MNQESLRGKDSELRIRVEFDRIQIRPSKKQIKLYAEIFLFECYQYWKAEKKSSTNGQAKELILRLPLLLKHKNN